MTEREFAHESRKAKWHPNRIRAWIYCKNRYGTSFPDDSWSLDQVLEVSNQTLEIYQNAHRSSTKSQILHGVTEGLTEAAVHIGFPAIKSFLGRR